MTAQKAVVYIYICGVVFYIYTFVFCKIRPGVEGEE